jgi:methionine-rich copper-binding protein CopC
MHSSTRTVSKLILTVAAIGAIGIAATRSASAATFFHVKLLKAAPGPNDTVHAAPTAVKLWFSEAPELAVTTIKLRGAGGDVKLGTPRVEQERAADGKTSSPVVVPIQSTLAPGAFTVTWRTMSKDSHVMSGTYRFVLK